MEKEFIPYKEAVSLKELGFDEPCFGYYHEDKSLTYTGMVSQNTNSFWKINNKVITAPTFSQASRWFREKYGLEIILRPDAINAPEKKLREYVILSYDKSWILEPIVEPSWWIRKGLFDTYEEAELACLNKLIEIVKTTNS